MSLHWYISNNNSWKKQRVFQRDTLCLIKKAVGSYCLSGLRFPLQSLKEHAPATRAQILRRCLRMTCIVNPSLSRAFRTCVIGHPSPSASFRTCVIKYPSPSVSFPTFSIGNPSGAASEGCLPQTRRSDKGVMDSRRRLVGITEGDYYAPAGVVPFMHERALASA